MGVTVLASNLFSLSNYHCSFCCKHTQCVGIHVFLYNLYNKWYPLDRQSRACHEPQSQPSNMAFLVLPQLVGLTQKLSASTEIIHLNKENLTYPIISKLMI